MDVKYEYLGAGGNPISTALERGQSLFSHVLTYPNADFLLRSPLRCKIIQRGIMYYALYSAPSS